MNEREERLLAAVLRVIELRRASAIADGRHEAMELQMRGTALASQQMREAAYRAWEELSNLLSQEAGSDAA